MIRLLIAVLIIVVLLVPIGTSSAQEEPPPPVTEQASLLGQVLTWLIAVFGMLTLWSGSVRTIFENVVKPILTVVLSFIVSDEKYITPLRTILIVGGIFLAAYQTALQDAINIFWMSPWEETIHPDAATAITAVVLTAAAIGLHNAIDVWVKSRPVTS